MLRFVSAFKPITQLQCCVINGIQKAGFATAQKSKKKRQLNKVGDMHAPIIVNELSMDDFLNPTKPGLVDSLKAKYYNWNSEYNIKKTFKTYKSQDMNKVVVDLLQEVQIFFSKSEIENAAALITPNLLKTLKKVNVPLFPPSQLRGLHKDIRYVGYSLSYLDSIPQLMQTRVIKSNNVLYGQLTFGLRCVEDIYGWTARGTRVLLNGEFPMSLPVVGGLELPLESKQSEWIENEDGNHNKYYYNSVTKLSSWTNPDEYSNHRRLCSYLCVLERPILSTMGNWRFQKI